MKVLVPVVAACLFLALLGVIFILANIGSAPAHPSVSADAPAKAALPATHKKSSAATQSPKPAPRREVQPKTTAAAIAERTPRLVDFDIKGMRIGDVATPEFVKARFKTGDGGEFALVETIDIDGEEASIHYHFNNFRLLDVGILFKSASFPKLVDAYSAKFGVPPHESATEALQTRAGVKYENEIVCWHTRSGVFIIKKYSDTVVDGHAQLRSPEAIKYWEQQDQKKNAALRSKL